MKRSMNLPERRLVPGVLIKLGAQWSQVGHVRVVQDEDSGMRMLRLDLSATAPTLYIPLQGMEAMTAADLAPLEAVHEISVGHA